MLSHFPIHTIGYQLVDVEAVVRSLTGAGVRRLIDIRAVPISRKKGFSKHVLARALAEHGIEYVHLKALGTPLSGRAAARAGDLAGLREIFGRHMESPEAQEALHQAIGLATAAPSCLLCFERLPDCCHRRLVAQDIHAHTGLDVVDIIP
jgi:uncharacterized protein (DUF488 family)